MSYRDGADDVTAVLGRTWTRDGSGTWVLPAVVDGVDPHAAQAIADLAEVDQLGAARLERRDASAEDGFVEQRLELDGLRRTVFARHAVDDGVETVSVDADGWLTTYTVRPLQAASGHAAGGAGPSTPVPGTVTHVAVAVGDVVEAGQTLVVLEAMKMEHTIRADADGIVDRAARERRPERRRPHRASPPSSPGGVVMTEPRRAVRIANCSRVLRRPARPPRARWSRAARSTCSPATGSPSSPCSSWPGSG